MRLLALVHKPVGVAPGQRFRLEQWAPHLAARHGITLDFSVFESPRLSEILYRPGHFAEKASLLLRDTWRRRSALGDARGYDAVVIYREAALLGPAIYERLLASARVPLLYDFDDAIWIRAESANGVFSHLRFPGKTATICRIAGAVVVGNQYLASYARKYNPSVFVVPTTIDLARYEVQPEPASDDPLVIAWSGSLSTLAHLEVARPAIERLGRRRRVVLRVICNRAPERPFAGVETDFVPWREEGEAQAIGASHVGIMPLPDDRFARGKCGLKALQYMAVGRPVVISPVGMNVDLVRHGENGLLADSEDEWVDALERLAASPALRADLGRAGRRTVEEGYSAETAAARFAEAARSVVTRSAG